MKSRRGRIHRTGVSNLDSLDVPDHSRLKPRPLPFSNVLKEENRSQLLSQSGDLSRIEKRKIIQSMSPPPKTTARKFVEKREETPLPKLPRSRSTVRDAKVSMATINSARKALRQRYVNRSNFRKIFNVWDRGNLGVVRPEDVHYMTNKLGIPISKEEAELLVASANRSRTGNLNLDEFLDLLFSEEAEINAPESSDLATVRATLEERAIQQREKGNDDILKSKIKSRLHELTQDMVKRDFDGEGRIRFSDFCVIMDTLKLPAEISNLKQWEKVYNEMGGDTNGLDYRAFAEKFKGLDRVDRRKNPLVDEYSQKLKPLPSAKVPVSSHAFSVENYTVLDGQKVPVNALESIQTKARKLKRMLRGRYQNEAALREELQRVGEGEGIPLAKLKNFMNYEATKEAGEVVTKRDVEGFLSAFQYNTDGKADVSAVAKSIFSEEYSDDTLTRKTRAMPPSKPRMSDTSPTPPAPGKLKSLLSELENKLFVQRGEQAYSAFKLFDADGDGYVSHEDFEKGLKSLNVVHEAGEARQLMEFLDENKNGFLSFKEFAKGVRSDMVTSHAKRLLGRDISPSLQPSKEFYQRHLQGSSQVAEDHDRARQAYLPDGKTPEVYHTVGRGIGTKEAMQPPSTASMYIDERDRLRPKNLEPISLTKEDKERKSKLAEAKLHAIQEYRGREADHIAQLEEALAEHRNRKIWQKAQVKEEYEKRCKIQPA